MAIVTKEDYLERLRKRIGEELTDEDISLVEDFTDTIDDLVTRSQDSTDWKQKYEDLDRSWRQKYIDRFNSKVESDVDFTEEPTAQDDETVDDYEFPKTYEDLFTEKG